MENNCIASNSEQSQPVGSAAKRFVPHRLHSDVSVKPYFSYFTHPSYKRVIEKKNGLDLISDYDVNHLHASASLSILTRKIRRNR